MLHNVAECVSHMTERGEYIDKKKRIPLSAGSGRVRLRKYTEQAQHLIIYRYAGYVDNSQ
jgi:hypothetical protein